MLLFRGFSDSSSDEDSSVRSNPDLVRSRPTMSSLASAGSDSIADTSEDRDTDERAVSTKADPDERKKTKISCIIS